MNKEQIHRNAKKLHLSHTTFRYGQSVWTCCAALDSALALKLDNKDDAPNVFYIEDGDVDMPEFVDRFITEFLSKFVVIFESVTTKIINRSGVVLLPIEDMFDDVSPNLINQRATLKCDFEKGDPPWFIPAWDEERNTAVWFMIDDPDFIYDYCIPVFDDNWIIETNKPVD